MNKITVVLCEGIHDISFISRILMQDGYEENKYKVKEYISPLNLFFNTIQSEKQFIETKLGYNPNYLIPSESLLRKYEDDSPIKNHYIFFHNLQGDGKTLERKNIIKRYKALLPKEDGFSASFNFKFRFITILDADDHGVLERVTEIKSEFEIPILLNGKIEVVNDVEYGCYIYHDVKTNKGTLEDILLEIFKNRENNLYRSTKSFIETNKLIDDRTKEIYYEDNLQKYKGKSKFNEKKSIISIMGQLQFSGTNNSVIIKKSDYIGNNCIMNNYHCKKIKELFK